METSTINEKNRKYYNQRNLLLAKPKPSRKLTSRIAVSGYQQPLQSAPKQNLVPLVCGQPKCRILLCFPKLVLRGIPPLPQLDLACNIREKTRQFWLDCTA